MGSPSWHDYRDRWRAVAAIEREEQRAASLTERWKQLNYLYLLGQGLALLYKDSLEETIWQRWAKLKSKT
ncbi:MAG: hypothetical protein P8X95_01905 [Anaerolineales bacterium]|jgi:hypothetical protein